NSWLNYSFNINALLAIVLVGLICGAVGSLVVGNRMAFFSDALAHCAFAGVTLGIMISLATRLADLEPWLVPLVMIAFGVLVGLAIAYVRENTTLANDTVIGVFFALATGFGAMLLATLRRSSFKNPENFLFGNPVNVEVGDIVTLAGLAVASGVVLMLSY